MFQGLIVFLYCFKPNYQYLCACGSHILVVQDQWKKEKNQELNFTINRVLKMIISKITKSKQDEEAEKEKGKIRYKIKYQPPFYQIWALQFNREIWLPIFFSTGQHLIIAVSQDDTIENLKIKTLQKVDLNMERINPKYFGIMETINEPTQINQRILPDETNVWQILSKWEHQRQQLQR